MDVGCKRKELSMSPRFLPKTTRKMRLPFNEMGRLLKEYIWGQEGIKDFGFNGAKFGY